MSVIVRSTREMFRPADIDRLVGILEAGGLAVLPVDTVYGLIGRAFDSAVFERMDAVKGDRRLPYAAIFTNLDSIEEWTGGLGYRQRRFANALLPGPLTLILNLSGNIPLKFRYGSSGIGVRVSSDPLLSQLAARLSSPIWATSANRSDEPPPSDFRSVNQRLLQEVDIALDAGPTIFHEASTVVDLRSGLFHIVRKGPWLNRIEKAIARSDDPLEVVVVCSGNICRSPIAAALLSSSAIDGCNITSVGLDAIAGETATREMIDIAGLWGVDLTTHRSKKATAENFRDADIIFAATPAHRDRIIKMAPTSIRKTFLLGESIGERTIPDPYESGREMYLDVANMIREAVSAWGDRLKQIVVEEFSVSLGKYIPKQMDSIENH